MQEHAGDPLPDRLARVLISARDKPRVKNKRGVSTPKGKLNLGRILSQRQVRPRRSPRYAILFVQSRTGIPQAAESSLAVSSTDKNALHGQGKTNAGKSRAFAALVSALGFPTFCYL